VNEAQLERSMRRNERQAARELREFMRRLWRDVFGRRRAKPTPAPQNEGKP
jgi:hypothetical protein